MGTRDPNPDVDELLRYNGRPRPLPPPTSLPRPARDPQRFASGLRTAAGVFLILAFFGLFVALGWWWR